jgi:hypothetical protein
MFCPGGSISVLLALWVTTVWWCRLGSSEACRYDKHIQAKHGFDVEYVERVDLTYALHESVAHCEQCRLTGIRTMQYTCAKGHCQPCSCYAECAREVLLVLWCTANHVRRSGCCQTVACLCPDKLLPVRMGCSRPNIETLRQHCKPSKRFHLHHVDTYL